MVKALCLHVAHTVSGQLRSDVTDSPDAPAVWKLETVSGNADIFLMQ